MNDGSEAWQDGYHAGRREERQILEALVRAWVARLDADGVGVAAQRECLMAVIDWLT